MSEDSKQQTATDFYQQHKERGGFDNDSNLIDKVAEAFPIDQPKVEVRERLVVPDGYVPESEEVAEYGKLRKADPDFDLVRGKMIETLTDEEKAEANTEHSAFVWHYQRAKESLTQEKEAKAAALAKVEASKKFYRSRMESRDPKIRQSAEVDYLLKHVKV